MGLSGGVDSAVSAALLTRAGAEVTGVFIKGWYPPGMPCTWAADRRDAMRVAARLQIPFRTFDASVEYKKSVIDYLLAEYGAGRTPNPDVMCNKEVKFGAFYRYALESGADTIATGHYTAGEKDQRYFLWAVPRDVFEKVAFPVGRMDKGKVRTLAKKFNLPVAEKKDSQGVCFLGSVSVAEFLRSEFGSTRGPAVDTEGLYVGEHDGALFYTLGERVALSGTEDKGQSAQTGPWFVLAKNMGKNELVVGNTRAASVDRARQGIIFKSANWFDIDSRVTQAQYRYRGPRVAGYVEQDHFVPTETLVEIPTAGQSIVFYDKGDELVGGGIIAG